ncbi:alpha-L-rhamnosidase [Bacteroides sp.]|uniref:alpha-L-rhamnosidase n=1 Tax=Bacteroides sp. TaxID=29523 RepID=UPI002638B3FF|nr:alpha-L-rhamnosidase [Bacteroides sp.]MDD3039244.1 family 78 glycoside hydrolase catalytic domain [Bacteroides sp.]
MKYLNVSRLLVFSLFTVYSYLLCAAESSFYLKKLQVEYAETPLGIDVEKPRFSWQMAVSSDRRGCMQAAYQITVTDEHGTEVWNSGKVVSDLSLNIEYEGQSLQPVTHYLWTLRVWDTKGKSVSASSWFETGLMCRNDTDEIWGGAKWIGGGDDDQALHSQYLPVYRLDFALQLDKQSHSTKAGFIYGANDHRLMNKFKNLYHLQNAKDESYVMIELDIAPLISGKEAQVNVYRVGYHPADRKEVPLKSLTVPASLINENNKYEKHILSLTSIYGITHLFIDNDQNKIGEVNLNPIGRGGDFITFPVLGDVGYSLSEGQSANFSEIRIRHYQQPSNIIRKIEFATSPGSFRTLDPSRNSMPMLRTQFVSEKPEIKKARLYTTSRGIYEVYMNGNRIGNDYFNPGLTQYNKMHIYQTFDVTDYILEGENVIGALLGEGWWSGGCTYSGELWNYFGDRQSLLAKLVVTYADGTEKVVVTDPSCWQYFNEGPIRYGSFFQGEIYDARNEKQIEGWSTPDYKATLWKPVREIMLDGTVSTAGSHGWATANDYSDFCMTGQFGQTIKAIKELTAISVNEVRPGVFVYDMGQNMAGVPKISLSGIQPGTKVYLRFAEVTYPDLPEYKGNIGMIMLENIRGAMAQDIYITKGGDETISPRFTYHGYRYLEITGIEKPLPLESVKGVVLSSIDGLTANYETSNAEVNRLWQNILWSTYANFMSVPTDCPQRNERLGWGGDISVFSRTATYMASLPQFLRRHMFAMRQTQRADGRFADIAPLGGGFGGLLWGSAGITVAWESYQQYNDRVLLSEHYDAMKHYIQYVLEKCFDPSTGVLIQERAGWNLGDWLGLEDGKNDKTLLWESYFIRDLDLMQKIAMALNKNEDAEWYKKIATERRDFFARTYIHPATGKTIASGADGPKKGDFVDIQTSYVLPLAFNLVDSAMKDKLAEHLVQTVTRNNKTDQGRECPPYSLMTGFIGTAWINQALSENGHQDIAYKLLQQTTYPSWLYPVEQGATTIWERLNSYTHLDGFGGNNSMNSFNHYSFGAVGAWMCNYSLGIQRDENYPGFKHFILKPEVDTTGKMTYANGYFDSMYGRIKSSWRHEKDVLVYQCTVPANTTARVYLPAASLKEISEGNQSLKKSKGVKYIGAEDGKVVLDLSSGDYSFKIGR